MQQSRNNKFDQQVKNTLENASVEPPAFLWNAIESKLPPSKTWYSKYKYLLLLLLLVFTSASSIYVYKNIFLKNSSSQIALNKRLLKDEIGQNSDAENSGNKLNSASEIDKSNVAGTKTDLTSPENKSDLNNSKPSVSSFYSTDKNVAKNEAALYAEQKTAADVKRAARLKRLEVQPENQEAVTKSYDAVTALVPQKKQQQQQLLLLLLLQCLLKKKAQEKQQRISLPEIVNRQKAVYKMLQLVCRKIRIKQHQPQTTTILVEMQQMLLTGW
ncbi:MAG: hypothetical protein IPP60_11470 [Sphingobacteriales bacterium]|nr:hypothetical protein [Sphingobacteriales bacterium]